MGSKWLILEGSIGGVMLEFLEFAYCVECGLSLSCLGKFMEVPFELTDDCFCKSV